MNTKNEMVVAEEIFNYLREEEMKPAIEELVKIAKCCGGKIEGVRDWQISHVLKVIDVMKEEDILISFMAESKLVAVETGKDFAAKFSDKFFGHTTAKSLIWLKNPSDEYIVVVSQNEHLGYHKMINGLAYSFLERGYITGVKNTMTDGWNITHVEKCVEVFSDWAKAADVYGEDVEAKIVNVHDVYSLFVEKLTEALKEVEQFKDLRFYKFLMTYSGKDLNFKYSPRGIFYPDGLLEEYKRAGTINELAGVFPRFPGWTPVAKECLTKILEKKPCFETSFRVFRLALGIPAKERSERVEGFYSGALDYLFKYAKTPEQLLAICHFGDKDAKALVVEKMEKMYYDKDHNVTFYHVRELFIACDNDEELRLKILELAHSAAGTTREYLEISPLERATEGAHHYAHMQAEACANYEREQKEKGAKGKSIRKYRKPDNERALVLNRIASTEKGSFRMGIEEDKIMKVIHDYLLGDGSVKCLLANIRKVCECPK